MLLLKNGYVGDSGVIANMDHGSVEWDNRECVLVRGNRELYQGRSWGMEGVKGCRGRLASRKHRS